MNNTAKSLEPTMEEILASIRRIIADDETAQPRPSLRAVETAPPAEDELEHAEDPYEASLGPQREPAASITDDEDVLDLSEPVIDPGSAGRHISGNFRQSELHPFAEMPRDLRDPEWPSARSATEPVLPADEDNLVAPETVSAVASAFGSLNNTILGQKPRTIEDLVQDMLRPMLKEWLDDNLPTMVEHLVRAEIERVSRGPRR